MAWPRDWRRPEVPRYALVAYADNTLGVVPFEHVDMLVTQFRAVVIVREFDPVPWYVPDNEQSNPRRVADTEDD